MRDLTDSIRKALAAVKEHDDALAKYEGYDWGYHGHRERTAMDEAVGELEQNIRELIDEQVQDLRDTVESLVERVPTDGHGNWQ